jgi:hypothetical protein
MHAFPKSIRLLLALVMALVACSGIAGVVLSARHAPAVWASLGFESVIAIVGLAGIWYALGKSAHGRAIGLFNLGGVLLVAALTARFSWHTTVTPDAIGVRTSIMYGIKDPWFLTRGLLGLLLMAMAAFSVLRLEAISWRRAIIGILLVIPSLVAGGYILANGTGSLFPPITDFISAMRMGFSVLAGLAICVLFAVGIHLVVKAFELAGQNPSGSAANNSPDASPSGTQTVS